jgi:glycosyltransferase involved in cell wall biosynthesis
MNLLYVSGHRFIKCTNGEIYTTGQMGENYFARFKQSFDRVTVIGFYEEEISKNKSRKIEKIAKDSTFLSYCLIKSSEVPIFRNVFTSYKIMRTFKSLIKSYDIIATKAPSFVSSYAVKIAKKKQIPCYVELVGCPWDAFWNHSWKGKLVAPFMWYATKKAVKNAPYVLYVTNEFLQRRYPNTGRTINCSNVALPTLDESVLDARLHKIKQTTKNKPIVIGTTAAVDVRYKGQDYVIQAIAELNKQGYNYEYRLVGGGDKARLQSIAEKYRVADKVIFEGSIPHERVFDYLDDIDIYVQPSKTEGLPRALIEAMSRGCPCIGSNAGGIPELLDNAYIFRSGNVKELVTILANFDVEKMVKQAKRNFEFSKGYAKEVIETRRNEFFKQFAESVENS